MYFTHLETVYLYNVIESVYYNPVVKFHIDLKEVYNFISLFWNANHDQVFGSSLTHTL